ncbi:MAG: Fe-S cluster assembly protein SufD [Muribaculaceae bacterium]|nr:Fe-S cluster assembly protein SufD [Muribaculaceae bacterium]
MKSVNSLEQYLEFYRENEKDIKSDSPDYVNVLRDKAFKRLEKMSFPDTNVEGYEKTSINEMFSPNLGINLKRLDLISQSMISGCGVTTLQAIRVIVHNDVVVRISLPHGMSSMPDGLTVMPLKRAWTEFADDVKQFLQSSESTDDTMSLLNLLLLGDGVYIKISPNTNIEVPIQIVNYAGGNIPMLATRRLLIDAQNASSVKILSCQHSVADEQIVNLVNEIVQISAGEEAGVEYVSMEESARSSRMISQLVAHQSAHSSLKVGSITLVNGSTRNNFAVFTDGDHTKTSINGLVIGNGTSHTDNYTYVSHSKQHGFSSQLFKYVLDDESKGVFQGRIVVEKDSRFNEAYQTNRNIVASKGGRMYSKPQLMIYNDDVKCSHGATTGQLDTRALFYMQTRGIPLDEARSMLMQAFMADVIDKFEIPGFTARLGHLVEQRLRGENLLCKNCLMNQSNG